MTNPKRNQSLVPHRALLTSLLSEYATEQMQFTLPTSIRPTSFMTSVDPSVAVPGAWAFCRFLVAAGVLEPTTLEFTPGLIAAYSKLLEAIVDHASHRQALLDLKDFGAWLHRNHYIAANYAETLIIAPPLDRSGAGPGLKIYGGGNDH